MIGVKFGKLVVFQVLHDSREEKEYGNYIAKNRYRFGVTPGVIRLLLGIPVGLLAGFYIRLLSRVLSVLCFINIVGILWLAHSGISLFIVLIITYAYPAREQKISEYRV